MKTNNTIALYQETGSTAFIVKTKSGFLNMNVL